MSEDFKEQLKAEYLARAPTQESSRLIVRELAAVHSLSEAKVRSVLVGSGVYISQPRTGKEASAQQKQAIFERLSTSPEGIYVSTGDLAKEFNLTWNAVYDVESAWRVKTVVDQRKTAAAPLPKRKSANPIPVILAGPSSLF